METRFVQTPRARHQYFEHGHGPDVIVLVHGYEASGRIWRLTQEALDPARFRSIAISNRGAGDSDHSDNEADYTIEAFADDLFATVQTLGLRDFTLVGHSLGGKTVTQFALDHPELLKALVLLDAGSLASRILPDGWEDELRRRFQAGATMPDRMGADAAGVPQDFRQALAADIARNPLARLIGSRRSNAATRLSERLSEVRMPVLVASGDKDQPVAVEDSLSAFFALPKETRSLHIFHGAGHSPNVEMAAQFAAVLDRFITQTVPAATVVVAG